MVNLEGTDEKLLNAVHYIAENSTGDKHKKNGEQLLDTILGVDVSVAHRVHGRYRVVNCSHVHDVPVRLIQILRLDPVGLGVQVGDVVPETRHPVSNHQNQHAQFQDRQEGVEELVYIHDFVQFRHFVL